MSCASQPPATTPPRAEPAVSQQPTETPQLPAEPEVGIVEPPITPIARRDAFIAVLLPLRSPDFGMVAEAFVRGVEAASQQRPGPLPFEVHATDASPEQTLQQYTSLQQQGAAVVIGPLTRSGVSAIATSGLVMVPTLALNHPDADIPLPPGLHTFGLSIEHEARMLAQRAYQNGVRRLALVGIPTGLSRRSRVAFLEEWQRLGGEAVLSLEAERDTDWREMRDMLTERQLDGVFLAAPYQAARMIRPYLPSQVPVYATSQVNVFPPDPVGMVDLNGVRFVDMPWLLAQDTEDIATFPRPAMLGIDALRFYALGVDAYLVASQLAEGQRSIELDGLTGHISLYPDGEVERRPWSAVFQDGVPLLTR